MIMNLSQLHFILYKLRKEKLYNQMKKNTRLLKCFKSWYYIYISDKPSLFWKQIFMIIVLITNTQTFKKYLRKSITFHLLWIVLCRFVGLAYPGHSNIIIFMHEHKGVTNVNVNFYIFICILYIYDIW